MKQEGKKVSLLEGLNIVRKTFIVDSEAILKQLKVKEAKTSSSGCFLANRDIAKLQNKPKLKKGELYRLLPEQLRKQAIELSEGDNLLSTITEGLNSGELGSKVIIALCQELYRQSEILRDTDQEEGVIPLEGLNSIIPKDKQIGIGVKEEKPFICPMICIELADFTRLVLGREGENYHPSTKDRDSVMSVLNKLDSGKAFAKLGDSYKGIKFLSIEGLEVGEKDSKGNNGSTTKIWIALRDIFVNAIASQFVRIRKDTLKQLRGRQKEITLRLFWTLVEYKSYSNTRASLDISKLELLSRVAIINSYDRNPKRREQDFKEAIQRMKEIKLLEKDGYTETENANNDTISHFKFNPKYETEAPEN